MVVVIKRFEILLRLFALYRNSHMRTPSGLAGLETGIPLTGTEKRTMSTTVMTTPNRLSNKRAICSLLPF
jgi:hypothetical protein